MENSSLLLWLTDITKNDISLVGSKAANLASISDIDEIYVPDGFCITSEVFRNIVHEIDGMATLLNELSSVDSRDHVTVRKYALKLQAMIKGVTIPPALENTLLQQIHRLGINTPLAIRSSSTAEDLPLTSFAGQHDSYLNLVGKENILRHVKKCWASLFTDRAIIYRLQNGFDHHKVYMAVIIQKLIKPEVSGIMFTADPLSCNRKILKIEASFGLGESLVTGNENPDSYTIIKGSIIEKSTNAKLISIAETPGETTLQENESELMKQLLDDEKILELERLGRKIEKHFGSPQDIEWCLTGNKFYVVQSRPITTLFPIPSPDIQENRIYLSVGHQQMMTDAMKPLGISMWRLPNMHDAGGRLFADVTPLLQNPASRDSIINVLGKFDPLVRDALKSIVDREGFLSYDNKEKKDGNPLPNNESTTTPHYEALNDYDQGIIAELINKNEKSLKKLKEEISQKSGIELLDYIKENIKNLRIRIADPQSMGVIMTAMNAASWINEKMFEWLGEKNVADIISQSLPDNITAQMGLELLDVADVIRPYPQVIQFLENVKDNNFMTQLPKYEGGQQTLSAIQNFLFKYGMRCAGEIDITRNRWNEDPRVIIPMILTNLRNCEPGSSQTRFASGLNEALKKEKELVARIRLLPGGEQKALETSRMIKLVRTMAGFREYPKFHMVSCYYIYKQAILRETEKLIRSGIINNKDDIYYLTFEELREVINYGKLDYTVISLRKTEFNHFEKLTPPRVMTSEGEIITCNYHVKDIPVNAIAGMAVSSGIVEGRARVILKQEEANLEEGDILVTIYSDPSWTPLFVSIKGLITEVGGLMTHGAVIAREYGLPAVVGVQNATQRIRDGQMIRLNGTDGYIELL